MYASLRYSDFDGGLGDLVEDFLFLGGGEVVVVEAEEDLFF